MHLNPQQCQSHLPILFTIVPYPYDLQFHYVSISETNLLFPVIFFVICAFTEHYIPLKHPWKSSFDVGITLFRKPRRLSQSRLYLLQACTQKEAMLLPPYFPENTIVWTPVLLTRVSWSSECNIRPAALTPSSCCHGDNGRIHSLFFAMLVIQLF